jgi:hypothetical protein
MSQKKQFVISERIALVVALEVLRDLSWYNQPELFLDEITLDDVMPRSRRYNVVFSSFQDRQLRHIVEVTVNASDERWVGGAWVAYHASDQNKGRFSLFQVRWSKEGDPTVEVHRAGW